MRHTAITLLIALFISQALAELKVKFVARVANVNEAHILNARNDNEAEDISHITDAKDIGDVDKDPTLQSSIDERSCEKICPRYYRPLCVSRDGELITYATPCEFKNELQCARVAHKRDVPLPKYKVLFDGACE
ncbi:uncharacterized protein LOC115629891 [Scaptodrosophila lebanonensis]|uniref:Uncharacterized protein LOC115629891 n=1 Tax=Drosophila lebanonensis TaxID=7225 RepID=A0A6J2U4E4_DROLE|nr:uncharacterized protein LOC115629891 [Scaptodrosophila lebanonensis]